MYNGIFLHHTISPRPSQQTPTALLHPFRPLPLVVPRRLAWRLDQRPGILDGNGLRAPQPRLLHGLAVQVPLRPGARPSHGAQRLAGMLHAGAQAHQFAGAPLLALASKEQPGAVDGPVAQVAVARHAQRGADLAAGVDELHNVGRLGVEFGDGGGAAGAARGGALVELVGGLAAWFEALGGGGLGVGFALGGVSGEGCGKGAGQSR